MTFSRSLVVRKSKNCIYSYAKNVNLHITLRIVTIGTNVIFELHIHERLLLGPFAAHYYEGWSVTVMMIEYCWIYANYCHTLYINWGLFKLINVNTFYMTINMSSDKWLIFWSLCISILNSIHPILSGLFFIAF